MPTGRGGSQGREITPSAPSGRAAGRRVAMRVEDKRYRVGRLPWRAGEEERSVGGAKAAGSIQRWL